jgi:hypothetical protein
MLQAAPAAVLSQPASSTPQRKQHPTAHAVPAQLIALALNNKQHGTSQRITAQDGQLPLLSTPS